MNVYAWSGAPATVTEEKSTSHTLGVAISTDDSFSHLKADGSATLEFKTVRGGVQGNVVNATMWNYVNYRDNEVTCPFGGPATYHRVPTGLYELMPGINTYTGVVHFHQSGAPHNPPFRWYTENAKNVTYSVGVQFGPFGLSAQSGYGSSDQIEFNFTQFGRICGSNPNGPLVSAQVDTQSGPC
jgi:hypothetical protein